MDVSFLMIFICLLGSSARASKDRSRESIDNIDDDYYTRSIDFVYPKYSYKRSSNVESRFKSSSNRCEFTTACAEYSDVAKQNCILRCISRKCYDEIYSFDPLEEGEIDQRITSFKGCLSLTLV